MAAIRLDEIRLMGPAEIQARLRVNRQRTYQLVTRRDFPAPRWKLAMGNIWLADDVEAWIAENRPHLLEPEDQL